MSRTTIPTCRIGPNNLLIVASVSSPRPTFARFPPIPRPGSFLWTEQSRNGKIAPPAFIRFAQRASSSGDCGFELIAIRQQECTRRLEGQGPLRWLEAGSGQVRTMKCAPKPDLYD